MESQTQQVVVPSSSPNVGYPHRLSASTVSAVCARASCNQPAIQPQQQQPAIKNDCIEYYISSDPSCLPPPPPSSCSPPQVPHEPPSSCKDGELSTDCKCLSASPSQPIFQHDTITSQRFRKNNFESNTIVEQRVISVFLATIV